ncbi:ABC transporter ATP-binding protein [Alicyclobacillus tolerans]|uniref:Nickel import system ATP-binding protein NikD n=2 Tax=Alicyclobacillus tolerans TaxID=90970 RepID=A0A1M6QL74_9BACL|nr:MULTISPECIES: ABC transporter ATP-binding protein [Alicyclobacillus]MDP9729549.1 peptide/nickel transport system ATP-binding protein [Alicyclobacillus tengchongensis]QRF22766.1 ABC transporter ATP-binding protein [Alicyclobacillus sp. TC]SHK21039.1 peptide/nickel transport system ATP-binding protein [Alicyclobacillus montanus]
MSKVQPVLEIEDVTVVYDSPSGPVQAVSDVNLTVYPGTIVGLIGESGSGKSTLANAIMRLLRGNARLTKGQIRVMGTDIYALSKRELRTFRWSRMSMVFQSAMTALNPVMTVEKQIVDTFRSHRPQMSVKEAKERARDLLRLVRIDEKHLRSFPHELSGGMRQRVVIAIAIALEPQLVIMDEPTTALDVVVQRSILNQIQELQAERGFAILFISHDFSLVTEIASRVAIMYAGRMVENTEAKVLLPEVDHHPYTEGLMRAIPRLTYEDVVIEGIQGHPPDLIDLPSGCAYSPRCPYATAACMEIRPTLHRLSHATIECHLYSPTKEGDSEWPAKQLLYKSTT